jgi:23S rRNA pseudouridine2605 synthase
VSAPRRPGDDGRPVAKKKGWARAKPKAVKRPSKHRVRRDAKPDGAAGADEGGARAAKVVRTRKDGSVASGRADARRSRETGVTIDTKPETKRGRPPRRDEPATAGRTAIDRARPVRARKPDGAPTGGPAADKTRPSAVRRETAVTRAPAERARPRPEDRADRRPAGKPAAERAASPPDRGRTPRIRKDGSAATGDRVAREVRAEAHASREPQRIAKLLARAGVASRREIERMIVEGRIALNGTAIDTPATILTSLAGVTVDGQPVDAAEASRLFLFHKPTGLITAAFDPAGRATIYDRLPPGLPRVIPVGRLDLNTEGLLLLTNDGELKRKLELPSTGIPRVYRARAYGEVTQEMLESLVDGVEIDGVRYGPIDANLERRTGRNVWIEIKITEGKNREVRRVLEYLGLQVSRLIRTAYGEFVLADLPPGEVVEVRQHDLEEFRKTIR